MLYIFYICVVFMLFITDIYDIDTVMNRHMHEYVAMHLYIYIYIVSCLYSYTYTYVCIHIHIPIYIYIYIYKNSVCYNVVFYNL